MSDIEIAGPVNDLRGRATRGALITGVAQAFKVLVQLTSVVFLARLLTPSDFGVMGMVAPAYGFAMMFQDFGLTLATVQKPDINHSQLTALFWLNFGVSVVIGLILIGLAPVATWFYHDPRVGPVVMAFGGIMMIAGLGSQHMALINRHLRFGLLSAIDCAAAALGLITSLLFAMILHSYWALVAGSLVIALVPTAVSWGAVKWRPGPPRRAEGMREILGFGAGVTGHNFADFFARNIDNIMIGRTWGDAALGLYDRAYKLLLFPLQQVTGPLSRVVNPILAKLVDEPERYRRAFLMILSQMMLVLVPGVAWMVMCSDSLVTVLLGPQWAAAAPIFQALGVAALIQPFNNATGWLYISQGRSQGYMRWGVVFTVFIVISILVGLRWGAAGVALSYAIGEYLRTPLVWWAVGRRGPVSAMDLLRTARPHVIGAAAALTSIAILQPRLSLPPWLNLGLCLGLAYLAGWSAVALTKTGRAAIGETYSLALGLFNGLRLRRPALG